MAKIFSDDDGEKYVLITMSLYNLIHVFQTYYSLIKNNSMSHVASLHLLSTFLEHHECLKTNVFQAALKKTLHKNYTVKSWLLSCCNRYLLKIARQCAHYLRRKLLIMEEQFMTQMFESILTNLSQISNCFSDETQYSYFWLITNSVANGTCKFANLNKNVRKQF